MTKFCIILFTLLISTYCLIDIIKQGAVPNSDTIVSQFKNAQIIKRSILQANSSLNDRVVKIPAKHTFYSMPIVLQGIYNVSIVIEGKLSASKKILSWPKKPKSAQYQDFIRFYNCSYIQLSGNGKLDGRGYHWWMVQWLRLKKLRPLNSARPHLINIQRCQKFKIHDLVLKNSPCFHIRTYQSSYFDIYNLDIKVNTTAQFNLAKKFSAEGIVPLFPLNTDGIDPAGRYYHIWNLTVQNYDDVVVPKPSHGGTLCNCTQHILVQNITIRLGVGLSIGSVPPNSQHNCLRNITFKNAQFQKPFKGIYIKTNPGNSGSGEIKNILYQNMKINQPIWWAIYLGPQQQKQPLGGGPGCMLYPFDPRGTCQTQPRIDIRNVTLENIQVHNSLLFPIVLRCNETNPCLDINLKNIKVDKWHIGKKNKGYVCQFVKGVQSGGHPKLDCLTQSSTNNLLSESYQRQQWISENQIYKQLSRQQIWKNIEQHVKSVPYIEQDDEMDQINIDQIIDQIDKIIVMKYLTQ